MLRTWRPCVRNMRSTNISSWHRSTCVSGARAAVHGLHRGHACASEGSPIRVPTWSLQFFCCRAGWAVPPQAWPLFITNTCLDPMQFVYMPHGRLVQRLCRSGLSIVLVFSLFDVVKGAAFLVD